MPNRFLTLAFAFALALLAPTGASATAQRTSVASTGNDANPCSLAQPCRGFARALSQTSPSGEVIVLDSAGYGPVTITKSVSLIAPAGIHAGITEFRGDGITVDIPNGLVVLRGLTISGQGGANGIHLLAASRLRIESCVTQTNAGGEVIVLDSAGYGPVTITKSVSLIVPGGVYAGITVFSGDGVTVNAPSAIVVLRGLSINGQGGSNGVNVLDAARLRIENCVISGMSVDGVMYSAKGLELIVFDTLVRDNVASGIGGDADAFVVLDHVRSEHNGTNGFYMASLVAEARATITDSVFAFNSANGIWFAATGTGKTYAQVERSVLADNSANGVKISASSNAFIRASVARNALHRNARTAVAAEGPGLAAVAVSDNTILAINIGVSATGGNVDLVASGNSVLPDYGATFAFEEVGSSQFFSYGNNIGYQITSGTIQPLTGF